MASPMHKANIVKGDYTEIGTGIAAGVYEGHNTIFVVQVYANPPVNSVVQIPPASSQSRGKTNTVEQKPADVLGAEIENTSAQPIRQPNFWQKALASPRNATNVILYIIFGLITMALLLYIIFVKMENHHIDLITNGLIILAILGAVFIANYYLSHRNMVITQSLDYSNEKLTN